MVSSPGGQPRRMPRPAHAQPGALASLRWTSVLESVVGIGTVLVIAATAIASGGGSNPAAAVEPVPATTQDPTPSEVALGWTLQPPSSSTRTGASGPSSIDASSATQSAQQSAELAATSALAADGIPRTALQAYQSAAARQNLTDPGCQLPWPLLAAIGRVESDHGRFAGAVLHTDGLSTPPVIGIPLDGHGTALIRDTDNGRLDGDRTYDRAVGPMQFIPSTWAAYAVDGNSDGVADPFNIFDASAAAAHYLCAAGGNLATPAGQQRAVLAYNHSAAYLADVLHLEAVYAAGVPGMSVPIIPTGPPPPVPTHVPPVNPAPPPSITPTTSAAAGPTSTAPPTRRTSSDTSTPPERPGTSKTAGGSTTGSPSTSSAQTTCPAPSASMPTSAASSPASSTASSPASSSASSTATCSSPSPSTPSGGSSSESASSSSPTVSGADGPD